GWRDRRPERRRENSQDPPQHAPESHGKARGEAPRFSEDVMSYRTLSPLLLALAFSVGPLWDVAAKRRGDPDRFPRAADGDLRSRRPRHAGTVSSRPRPGRGPDGWSEGRAHRGGR